MSQEQIDQLVDHVRACAPEEGCGLLAGIGRVVKLTIPITNQLHSAVRYNMSPNELIHAFYDLEAHGFELLASFHSHPNGPETPSETDIQEFAYPGTLMVILSGTNGDWQVKSFEIASQLFIEIPLQIKS